jgi:L-aspartate semialdehyde sulfurtransferase ferredoxin
MAKAKAKKKTTRTKESKRYWLTFDAKAVRRPLVCEMGKKFDLTFDIRSANVTPEMGLMALELKGDEKVIASAVQWFRRRGVQVDPI